MYRQMIDEDALRRQVREERKQFEALKEQRYWERFSWYRKWYNIQDSKDLAFKDICAFYLDKYNYVCMSDEGMEKYLQRKS